MFMYYLAYGSNMSLRRMIARIPGAERIGIAILEGHQLRFHKISQKDGSGKCDILQTDNRQHHVHGVLFKITPEEKSILDEIEGLGVGYDEKVVTVILQNGKKQTASVFYAITIDNSLKPFHWYKEHVLRGAKENGFPKSYIEELEKVRSIADHDQERHKHEIALYR